MRIRFASGSGQDQSSPGHHPARSLALLWLSWAQLPRWLVPKMADMAGTPSCGNQILNGNDDKTWDLVVPYFRTYLQYTVYLTWIQDTIV